MNQSFTTVSAYSLTFCLMVLGAPYAHSQECSLSDIGLYLTDTPDHKELMEDHMTNKWSGYPDLKTKLMQVLCPCKGKIIGDAVPIELINGRYLKFAGRNDKDVITDHDIETVKRAYEYSWFMKNSGSGKKTLAEITQQCVK